LNGNDQTLPPRSIARRWELWAQQHPLEVNLQMFAISVAPIPLPCSSVIERAFILAHGRAPDHAAGDPEVKPTHPGSAMVC
jgi:hypothetical protein